MPKPWRSSIPRRKGIELLQRPYVRQPLPSRTLNHVPVTAIDARMDDGATFEHELEAGANAFLLVLEGSAIVGDKSGLWPRASWPG
jgi:redox-sensitive bicupin YhaK (pirin superfamily)